MSCPDNRVPLTPDQKRLVEENLGLVGVNLRRYSQPWSAPRRDREWDDLFQEGCLALMDAARSHQPERGIPFPAYALPRIRAALGIAIERVFTNIRTPLRRRRRRVAGDDESGDQTSRYPQQVPGDRELDSRPCVARHDPGMQPMGETVGDRVRSRFDRAVGKAVADVSALPDRRGDLPQLVHQIVDGRLTMPDEESRCSLRGLAEKTGSTYGRVVECEQRLLARMRYHLNNDPVFAFLRRWARDHVTGVHTPIDADLEQKLTERLAEEWDLRYRSASQEERARALMRLARTTQASDAGLAEKLFAQAPARTREHLVESIPRPRDHHPDRLPDDGRINGSRKRRRRSDPERALPRPSATAKQMP
ncbi:MAG: hypothetical protein IID37_00810 [Planctomycetes bacterium]|nr:hypothetical protein [Planctomycetota bacterium]